MYKRTKTSATHASPLLEPIGWYGMVAVVAAYGLLTLGTVGSSSLTYLGLNATGSAALAYHSLARKDSQPLVLNAIWLGIALFGFLR